VRCTLTADRTLPGQSAPVTTTHFVGTVRLTKDDVVAQSRKVPKKADGAKLDGEQVYTFYFHGPAYQVVSQAWRSGGGSVTKLVDPLPDNHVPADAPLVSAPRLAELCFQTSGLWEAGTEGRMALADPGGSGAGVARPGSPPKDRCTRSPPPLAKAPSTVSSSTAPEPSSW
jgi:hypothetical protein